MSSTKICRTVLVINRVGISTLCFADAFVMSVARKNLELMKTPILGGIAACHEPPGQHTCAALFIQDKTSLKNQYSAAPISGAPPLGRMLK